MWGMIHHYLAARAELDAPGSMFATTTATVRGVPVKVFAAAPPSMRMLWELSAGYADNEYLVYEDERDRFGRWHVHRQWRHDHVNAAVDVCRYAACASVHRRGQP